MEENYNSGRSKLFANESDAAHHDINMTSSQQQQDTNKTEYYPDFSQLPELRVTFIVVYVLISTLTVLGNTLVVYMVVCQKKMHNSVNYLICNLAVSDILVGAFVAPVKLLEMMAPSELQLLDSTLCMTLSFTQSVAIYATILTLVVISLERFFVIVYPIISRRFSNKFRTKIYIALTWIFAMLLSSPNLYRAQSTATSNPQKHLWKSEYGITNVSICVDDYDAIHPNFRKIYFQILFIVIYCIPMFIIIVTSGVIVRTLVKTGGLINRLQDTAAQRQSENRRKVAAMMIVVSFGFAVCWSPYFFVTLIVENYKNFFNDGHFFFSMLLINMLGFMNSCINPFIYIMNDRFREQYKVILHALCCGLCVKMGWMNRLHQWSFRRSTLQTTFSQISTSVRRMRAFSTDEIAIGHNHNHGHHHHDQIIPVNRAICTPMNASQQVLYSVTDNQPVLIFVKTPSLERCTRR